MSLKVIEPDGSLSPAPRNLPTELFVDFERRDDQAIMDELQGAVVAEYVYSFDSGGKRVMGLSLPGVMAVAQRMGGITCGQPIWSVTDADITCDISATDHKVGLTVWGTASAPFEEYGKRDKFARAKALSKAQRNAIRKVIPETVATQMLAAFLSEKRGGKQQRQQPQQPPRQQVTQPDPPRQIADATLDAEGRVITDDGEIVGQLEPNRPSPELLAAEFQRRLKGAHTADDLRDVSGWCERMQIKNDPDVKAAFEERRRELKAAAKSADVEQPELIEV